MQIFWYFSVILLNPTPNDYSLCLIGRRTANSGTSNKFNRHVDIANQTSCPLYILSQDVTPRLGYLELVKDLHWKSCGMIYDLEGTLNLENVLEFHQILFNVLMHHTCKFYWDMWNINQIIVIFQFSSIFLLFFMFLPIKRISPSIKEEDFFQVNFT